MIELLEKLQKQISDREQWDREWSEKHWTPLIERLKSMGYEIGYGFEYGRNGDCSRSNAFDALNKALDDLLRIGYYREEDHANGVKPPESLIQKAYEQMSEDCVDPDYMCDREGEYIAQILEDGPWKA